MSRHISRETTADSRRLDVGSDDTFDLPGCAGQVAHTSAGEAPALRWRILPYVQAFPNFGNDVLWSIRDFDCDRGLGLL